MAINKVVYGGATLVDLTGISVTPETMLEGSTALNKAGEPIAGIVPAVKLTVDSEGGASFGFVVDSEGNGTLSCISFAMDSDGNAMTR